MDMTEEQLQEFRAKLIHYINNARGYARYSGISVTKVEDDYCEGELAISPDTVNYLDIVHGGCLAALADTVAGIAACSTGMGTVTINYGFSFLRPAKGKKIRCIAEPMKAGRKIKVFGCALYDDNNDLVASGQFTFYMTGPLTVPEIKE